MYHNAKGLTYHKPDIFAHQLLANPGESEVSSKQDSAWRSKHPSGHHKSSVKFDQCTWMASISTADRTERICVRIENGRTSIAANCSRLGQIDQASRNRLLPVVIADSILRSRSTGQQQAILFCQIESFIADGERCLALESAVKITVAVFGLNDFETTCRLQRENQRKMSVD